MCLNPRKNRKTLPASASRWIGLSVAWLYLFLCVPAVHGQADDPLAELKKNYEQSIEELRVAVKAAKRAETIHFHVESEAAFEYRELWEAAAADAETAYGKLRIYAIELFLAAEDPDEDLIRIVSSISGKLYAEGRIDKCYDVTKKLVTLYPEQEDLKTDMARAAILNNDFETAAAFADGNLGTVADFPPLEKVLFGWIERLKDQFSRELDLREAESKADDLPRVILKTTKGDIVIELFENEAPETVGNFVNLVEIGFYDEIIFHPVDNLLMAQAGLMSEDRLRFAGYTIYDEHQRTDARHHFRGSVCMSTPGDAKNAGSAIFYILKVPGPHIVDRHTVFGRVISDMDVVDSLQSTVELGEDGLESPIKNIIPETILSAKVVRKRDHEYVPNRVKVPPKPSEKSQ